MTLVPAQGSPSANFERTALSMLRARFHRWQMQHPLWRWLARAPASRVPDAPGPDVRALEPSAPMTARERAERYRAGRIAEVDD